MTAENTKQDNEITRELWLYNYRQVKREFWVILIILVFLPFCMFLGMCGKDFKTQTTTYFEEAISEYESMPDAKKIYPYGRKCLEKACTKCNSKDECLRIIKSEMSKQK